MLCAGYDYQLTCRRIHTYGPKIELNPSVFLKGPALAIFIPTIGLCLGLGLLPTAIPLAIYTGMRIQLLLLQRLSLRTEKAHPELFKQLFTS